MGLFKRLFEVLRRNKVETRTITHSITAEYQYEVEYEVLFQEYLKYLVKEARVSPNTKCINMYLESKDVESSDVFRSITFHDVTKLSLETLKLCRDIKNRRIKIDDAFFDCYINTVGYYTSDLYSGSYTNKLLNGYINK